MANLRIYYSGPLGVDHEIVLDPATSHRLVHVLRLRIGAKLIIFNGAGGQYQGQIMGLVKKVVIIKILEYCAHELESPLNLGLAQAIPRGEKMDFILQKAVELGVTKISPLYTKYCNVRLAPTQSRKRMQHWQKIIVHASEQSGRNRLLQLEEPQLYHEWLSIVKPDMGLILAPDASYGLPQLNIPSGGQIILVVGCEGGWHPDEVLAARERGFIPVRFGPRVLRTETASIAAAAILQFYYGDLAID